MPEPVRRGELREAGDVRDYVSRVRLDFTQMKSSSADPPLHTEVAGRRVKDQRPWVVDRLSGTVCMRLAQNG
jgi:hypothetical protein